MRNKGASERRKCYKLGLTVSVALKKEKAQEGKQVEGRIGGEQFSNFIRFVSSGGLSPSLIFRS